MTKEKAVQLIDEYLADECVSAEWVECLTLCRNALTVNEILKEENKALDIENSVLSRMLAEKCTECGYRKEKEDA